MSTAVQFTDMVSLCRFMTHVAGQQSFGAYNVAYPRDAYTLKDYLRTCLDVTRSKARLTWIPRAFLEGRDIRPYRDLPMWRPEPAGFYAFNADKALRAGLQNRPLLAPVEEMFRGYLQRHPGDDFQFGTDPHHGTISMQVEAEVLAAWHQAALEHG